MQTEVTLMTPSTGAAMSANLLDDFRCPTEEEWSEIFGVEWDPNLLSILQEIKRDGCCMDAGGDMYRDHINARLERAGLYKKYFVVSGSLYVR